MQPRSLSPKRARFVQEYLIDLNARAAAERAGYCGVIGHRLLRLPQVAEAITEGQAACAARLGLSLERVMAEIAAIGFSDIRRAISWELAEETAPDPAEPPSRRYAYRLKNSGLLDPSTGAAIAEFHRYSCGAVRLRMHDKLAALHLLARHLGAFPTPAVAASRRQSAADAKAAAEAEEAETRQRVDAFAALTPEQRAEYREALLTIHRLTPPTLRLGTGKKQEEG